MDSTRERDDFSQWYDRHMGAGDGDQTQAYGRRIVINARGRRKKRCYRVGTVILADDGLAFLRKVTGVPWWGVVLIFLGGMVLVFVATIIACLLIGSAGSIGGTSGVLGGLAGGAVVIAAGIWGRRPSNLQDVARREKSIADPASVFIPLSCITGVETCTSSGWGNPDHLRILFRRDGESPEDELILGDLAGASVKFDAPQFRHGLEQLLYRA